MDEPTLEQKLRPIMAYASKQKKGSYSAYEYCKRQLELLDITSREYERAIIKIAEVLRI